MIINHIYTRCILFVGLLTSVTACLNQSPTTPEAEGGRIPSFELLLADSITRFSTDNLPEDKPVVLFFFRPDCPYCQAQITSIITNIKSLKGIQFCVFTYASFTEFKDFYKNYHLEKYPNIIAGVDFTNFFGNYFKVEAIPYTIIYNKKRLKRVLIGGTDANKIRNIAND